MTRDALWVNYSQRGIGVGGTFFYASAIESEVTHHTVKTFAVAVILGTNWFGCLAFSVGQINKTCRVSLIAG